MQDHGCQLFLAAQGQMWHNFMSTGIKKVQFLCA